MSHRKRWSGQLTKASYALDARESIFTRSDPLHIARTLTQSAEYGGGRGADSLRAGVSRLDRRIERGAARLSLAQMRRLEAARQALRSVDETVARYTATGAPAPRPAIAPRAAAFSGASPSAQAAPGADYPTDSSR